MGQISKLSACLNIVTVKISIITVCKNADIYIEQTIQSIIDQTYTNIEYIIIDGGSTDNTLRIINKYKERITHFLSEKDNGIADAMNKGINLASGDYLLFINADDYLFNEKVIEEIQEHITDKLDLYLFQVLATYSGGIERKMLIRAPDWVTNFKMGACHQGQLISSHLFDNNGLYDTSFKICMDYDFILRAYRKNLRARVVNKLIAVMRQTGVSARTDWLGLSERFSEERKAHIKNSPGCLWSLIYSGYWFFYILYRKILFTLSINN